MVVARVHAHTARHPVRRQRERKFFTREERAPYRPVGIVWPFSTPLLPLPAPFCLPPPGVRASYCCGTSLPTGCWRPTTFGAVAEVWVLICMLASPIFCSPGFGGGASPWAAASPPSGELNPDDSTPCALALGSF